MPTEPLSLEIRLFNPSLHNYKDFDCGEPQLNNFLKLSAKKQQKQDMVRVYVLVESGSDDILGYHSINVGSMEAHDLDRKPRGIPAHGEIPVLFLGQVAVGLPAQRKGLGSILLHHVFEKAVAVADKVGCYAVLLDAMGDGGEEKRQQRMDWYAQFGFRSFPSRQSRMFMTMKDVRALVQIRKTD